MTFFASDALAADPVATTAATEQLPVDSSLSPEKMMVDNLMLLAALFAIFYFILLRPQQKRIKAHQEMVKSLAKGQKVITSGGIIGTISKVESDNVVVVEVAQGVRVRVSRSSISEVLTGDAAAGDIANDN